MKNLHTLVHSLSQSEKRYIKLRLNANKSNSNLITHFDFIVKQDVYDFSKIPKENSKSVKLLQTNLRLLYKVILKNLRSFNESKTTDNTLLGKLADINTLKEKGMILPAEKMNNKLILKAGEEENFEILKSAYSNLWNFSHLKGMLSPEKTKEVELLLLENQKKEIEVAELNALYREATTYYYQYFFHKRDDIYKEKIREINKNKSFDDLTSAKSRHTLFETKAMEFMVFGDIKQHHEIRKGQLMHLFSSPVFKTDYISKLLVLSNVFTFLKSKGAIKELEQYLNFMEEYFKPLLNKNPDGVLLEKFYDIYFLNNCFLQAWNPNKESIQKLIKEFEVTQIDAFKSNQLLASRTHLGLAELLILIGEYKLAIPHLIEFQDLTKGKKYSKHYIESELHFIAVYYFMDKMDVFENVLKALINKIKTHSINLDPDQEALFSVFKLIFKNKAQSQDYANSIKYKLPFKAYIKKIISNCSSEEARKFTFIQSDENYKADEDDFLKKLHLFK